MKTLIQVASVALIMGGLSATGSYLWNQSRKVEPAPEPAKTESAEGEKSAEEEPVEATATSEEPATNPIAEKQAATNAKLESHSFGPPVAARPPFEPYGDEAGDLINKLRVRATTASRQERRIAEREEVMKLIVDDLRLEQSHSAALRRRIMDETDTSFRAIDEARRDTETERAAILSEQMDERRLTSDEMEKLRRERDEALKSVEEALRAARDEEAKLQQQLDNVRKSETSDRSGSPEETTNLKKMVGVVDSMPPEDTAKLLQEMVDQGKTEAVVAVLNAMKPRQSAKVLSVLTEKEPTLAAELMDRLKRLKQDARSAATK